jgi:pSer/pThr/pTyr-binding forkhead associated (FHA) protein
MIRPLTAFAREMAADRDALAASIDCPVLLWEAGLYAPESGSDSEMTLGSGNPTTFSPNNDNPIVLQIRPESTRSDVAGIGIGRSESNDVAVQSSSVSRLHALIHRDARTGEWRITDAGSRNGTFVDGVPVGREQSALLKDGTMVKLGDVQLRFLLPHSFLTHLESRLDKLKP